MMEDMTLGNASITEAAPELQADSDASEGIEAIPAPAAESIEGDADQPNESEEEQIDYAALAAEDLAELKAQFPALKELPSLAALSDPVRYAELRDMGLSPKEAYLAIGGTARRKSDNRSHLLSAVPRSSALATNLPSNAEMAEARRLFSNLSDAQIHRLYKKVTN